MCCVHTSTLGGVLLCGGVLRMAEKEFKTIEEQIEILRSRGLSIQDDEQTKQFLLSESIR